MPLTYKVFYTPQAEEDIYQIALSLAGVTWVHSVEKWIGRILDRVNALAVFPEGGAVYELDDRFRSVKVGKYRIIYEIYKKERAVAILRVVYARRDLKKIMLE